MSSDTTKDNVSVVDSSLTGWKQERRNFEDPEETDYSHDRVGNSATDSRGKQCKTRYFIIKSLNHQNIQLSVKKGIWATQVMNEPILEEAFQNSQKVILIFSVNMSGFFQGYAQMVSSLGWRRENVWSQGKGKNNPWGRSFKVKWLCLNDLPFQKTLHLKNPLNDYKPVKISRDCQELPPEVGEALCQLLDGMSNSGYPMTGVVEDDYPSKRHRVGLPCSFADEENNFPALHLWSRTYLHYPSILYQHQGEAYSYHLAQQKSNGFSFPENSPITCGALRVQSLKSSQFNRQLPSSHGDRDTSSQFDRWGSSRSPLVSSLTDDDLLEMSYEEYLQAHSRSGKQLCPPVSGSETSQESSKTSKHDDDDDDDKRRCHKRTRHSSRK